MKLDEFLTAKATSAASADLDRVSNPATPIHGKWPRLARFAAMATVAVSALLATHAAVAQPEEGAYYRIKNINSKLVLALEDGAAKTNGAQIVQRAPGPNERQQWTFVKAGRFYKIVNRATGQALNVQNASMEERAPIIQWDASDAGENQQWSIQKDGGNYIFKARHSGMVIDVEGGSTERKAPVIQYTYHEGRNQAFELVPVK